MTLHVPGSAAGLLAVIYLLYILATLSRRLGQVTKMRPYYRGFYVAMVLITVAMIVSVLPRPEAEADQMAVFLIHYLSLIAGGLISLAIAYRYWSWLLRERIK